MTKLFIPLLFFCGIAAAQIQDIPEVFSLEQAISFALENNRTAKNARLDIQAAKKEKWETIAVGLPQLNAAIDYQSFIKQPVTLFDANNDGENEAFVFGTKQNVNATATLTQLIFDGSYLVGLQSAKVFLEISKNAKVKTDLEVRKAVTNAYANVQLSKATVEVLENDLKVVQQTLNETIKIYENGLEEEESVEQLQVTLLGIKSSLSNALRLQKIALQLFNLTLGIDVNNPSRLSDSLTTLVQQHTNLMLLEEQVPIENTIDYKIAKNDLRSKELLVKLEKSQALPTLSAFVNAGYTGNRNDIGFLNRNQKWFGSSLLGISLNIPIFSSLGRTAATQRAKINLLKAENNLIETEQELKLDIARARSEYEFALEDYKTKSQNLTLAERIERKNQIKFLEGLGSSLNLRQAQTQLYQAQQSMLQSMLNVITNHAALETLLNTVN